MDTLAGGNGVGTVRAYYDESASSGVGATGSITPSSTSSAHTPTPSSSSAPPPHSEPLIACAVNVLTRLTSLPASSQAAKHQQREQKEQQHSTSGDVYASVLPEYVTVYTHRLLQEIGSLTSSSIIRAISAFVTNLSFIAILTTQSGGTGAGASASMGAGGMGGTATSPLNPGPPLQACAGALQPIPRLLQASAFLGALLVTSEDMQAYHAQLSAFSGYLVKLTQVLSDDHQTALSQLVDIFTSAATAVSLGLPL